MAQPATYRGKPLSDPAVAHQRAVDAARSRTGTDYFVRKLVESAPTLTAEQAEQLRALLPPVQDGGRDAA